jgi:GMP synthase C terminal domain
MPFWNEFANRIINKVRGIKRVTDDITAKPPVAPWRRPTMVRMISPWCHPFALAICRHQAPKNARRPNRPERKTKGEKTCYFTGDRRAYLDGAQWRRRGADQKLYLRNGCKLRHLSPFESAIGRGDSSDCRAFRSYHLPVRTEYFIRAGVRGGIG